MLKLRLVLILLVLSPAGRAGADAADARSPILGSVVSKGEGLPVADATVVLLVDGHVVATVKTESDGRFRFSPVADGSYAVGVISGARPVSEAVVVAGAPVDRKLVVELPETESIKVYETAPVTEAEPPPNLEERQPLPYSAEAIDSDAWGSAVLLAYIDEHGRAVATQLLKRPGHGLDPIAIREVLAGTYTPARDAHGRTIRSVLVLRLEWPSYWWMNDMGLSKIDALVAKLPCAGSGRPLNFDQQFPIYRDCGVPPPGTIYSASYVLPPTSKDAQPVALAPRRSTESLTRDEKGAICAWTADLGRPYGAVADERACLARLDEAGDCDKSVGEVILCTMNKARDPSICGSCPR